MTTVPMQEWLNRLGYAAEPAALHLADARPSYAHPYALEVKALLTPDGAVRAHAVFDVDGVPTVVFLDGRQQASERALAEARKRIWNQNLATVVIDVQGDHALAWPARKLQTGGERLILDRARPDGPFSAFDVVSANLPRRMPSWFDVKERVDRKLLANLSATVRELTRAGFMQGSGDEHDRQQAELLMGAVLFISYLEHREIIGATYRDRRKVEPLHTLVRRHDGLGIRTLIDRLRDDFNGDFLDQHTLDPWAALTHHGFLMVDEFLRRTDMETGQGDFWNYDFSYIPVELLSGLYELFIPSEQQAKEGAYYTPRNLAILAVDQAFATSKAPLQETIFDGACGSGILLTTAYRRLIALWEGTEGRQMTFAERSRLLTSHIFGGDTNSMASRVTAFSLYLSLLEGLKPSDILEAQERDEARLPALRGRNLADGDRSADFFLDTHAFAGRQFSLVISNPPWAEPARSDRTSADKWADAVGAPFARRQIAGAFALRALDFLEPGGRLCLILPISQMLGSSSAKFVSYFLRRCQPLRHINFGDLQGLLFPTAANTCHLFVGTRRPPELSNRIPFGETFDYCVPKADLSLLFGRITMQSADLHKVQTTAVSDDPNILVTRMWGDTSDLALWTRLTARGRLRDFWTGPLTERQWVCRKGIHRKDSSRPEESAAPLRRMPFLDTAALKGGSPVLDAELLGHWPTKQETVVGLNDSVLGVFDGPRVVFPDGFSRKELNLRAHYYDGPASFTHSIGVIAGSDERDAALLKFTTVYLRSSLARYFLMMRGWKMLCERNGVHLVDLKPMPLYVPESAPEPAVAEEALVTAAKHMDAIAKLPAGEQAAHYAAIYPDLDELVFAYFALTSAERSLVVETVQLLLPSIRPRSFDNLDTPAQHQAERDDFESYSLMLADSLTSWRTRMGGRGRFDVRVVVSQPARSAPVGIVSVRLIPAPTTEPTADVRVDDELMLEMLTRLRSAGFSIIPSGETLDLVPDTHVWIGGSLYLVRPITKRSWTIRQALRDAEHIVRLVQSDTPAAIAGSR